VLVKGEWPTAGRWPAWSFSAASAAAVLTGAFPYALGIGFAIGSLVALRVGKPRLFALLLLGTLTASPLAFALLVTVLAGVAASKQSRAIVLPAIAVGIVGLFGVALWRVFPSAERFPFSGVDFVAVISFAVIGSVRRPFDTSSSPTAPSASRLSWFLQVSVRTWRGCALWRSRLQCSFFRFAVGVHFCPR
jgi:hypothetical protein